MTAKSRSSTSKRKPTDKAAGISSAAVAARTGRTWDEWFAELDRTGGRDLDHREIARLLAGRHGLGAWWSQMVTVGYEQACLGRARHQTPAGFEVTASKTVAVPVGRLYRAWVDGRTRRRWLPESGFEVRKATPDRYLRITWVDGKTHVDANFYVKGEARSQISVQHRKLADPEAAAAAKAMWAERLAALRDLLTG